MCRLSWPCLIVVLWALASLTAAPAAASAINSPRLIRKTRDVVTADKATPTPNVQRVRNTTYPACDQPDGSLIKNDFSGKAIAFTKDGLVPIYKSSDPVVSGLDPRDILARCPSHFFSAFADSFI